MALELKIQQKQIMSQKMVQSVEILQMTSEELGSYLNEQILENPVLEIGECRQEQSLGKMLEKDLWLKNQDEQNRYLYKNQERDEQNVVWNRNEQEQETLKKHLWEQLLMARIPMSLKKVYQYIVDSLDSRGYFVDSVQEVCKLFQIEEKVVFEVLCKIKSLDPAGIAASSLEECLCIQLERSGEMNEKLKILIQRHLLDLAKNRLPDIAVALNVSIEEVKIYREIIKKLNPKPGARFTDARQMIYIQPDVMVIKFKNHLDVLLNERLHPEIFLNEEYVKMSHSQEDQEVKVYLMEKIRQVEWLKQCIIQRNETLYMIAKMITAVQREFFLNGPEYLKPFKMSEAAERLDIHSSTVSRAVRGKYLQCCWGIYPMNYFFAKSISKSVQIEKKTAADAMRALAEIVEKEDKKKPYSDRMIAELLEERGFMVSRRTVAKYREAAGIMGMSGRRRY